ncbi:DNA-binding protein [Rathayibacter soli]|uniref:DNA-binding protein n=1 Tax=Rathayibacter soli TaxID=3144168 RepID=UPI0027E4D57F|nr:DNA-binding protein [Glaciibacter superstes]
MTTGREILRGGVRVADVEAEEVRHRGERLTVDRVDAIVEALRAQRAANLKPGGKSLSGGGKHSPTVQFRVPEELHEQALKRAQAEGVSLSKLGRKALQEYLRAS